ncbi:DUF1871 family protein [Pseudalkalibacillus hwajinpoensis]|uniref:DUF1871 family protein n=1 Tax=Guptibacillus hwajinpoensis TaxID=208199 RepID=UPI00325B1CA0
MNEVSKLNIQLVTTIKAWDPLSIGEDDYDTEAADVVQLVHQTDDLTHLSKGIQEIYYFSFLETIPLPMCKEMAEKLLIMKNNASCEL